MMLNFTGSDWCGWCIKLDEEVFSDPAFAAWATKSVTLVTVDFPNGRRQPAEVMNRNKELQEKYAVEGYPTIIIIDTNGKELGRLGYQPGGAKKWTAAVDQILAGK